MKSYRVQIITIVVLVACISALAFLFQGSRGLWRPDEGRYAGAVITMQNKGSFLIPYRNEDEIHLDKPIMIYWAVMGGLKLFGHNEFAVRFFHGLFFVFTSLAVGALSFSIFKNKFLALLSSLIYATTIVPFFAANFVTPDTLLAFWAAVCALCFWNSVQSQGKTRVLWQMLLCAAAGFGFLAKGPALLIPCGGMFVFLLVRKEVFRYFLTPWSLLGILIFSGIGLSWYIWVGLKIPGAFGYFIDSQVSGRLFTAKYNRNSGLIYALIYLPVLTAGSLPWSAVWLNQKELIKSTLFKKLWWKELPAKPETLFLLCYFFVPLIILCLASSKLGLYVLPIFVPLTIATAKLWIQKAPEFNGMSITNAVKSFARPIKLVGCWILLLLAAKLALAYYPTNSNMRLLWTQVKDCLPADSYELCTVDERDEGLIFYGVRKMEHLTGKTEPYPSFDRPEHITEEIQELIQKNENVIFLSPKDEKTAGIIEALKKFGISCRVVQLPYHRALLFPQLPQDNKPDGGKI